MKTFWFIPHAPAPVPSNPLTGQRRSRVSTIAPLNYAKASAIAATQRFNATKWHTLLEGLGYVHASSADNWTHEEAVLEGFNRFNPKTRNGAKYTFTSNWVHDANGTEAISAVVNTYRPQLNIHSRREYEYNIKEMVGTRKMLFSTNLIAYGLDLDNNNIATYRTKSRPFFYRWETLQDFVLRDRDYVTAGTELLWKPEHGYPDIWNFTKRDITERIWWHTIGQGHHHDRNTFTIDTRHTVGTTVTTPTGTYYLADDGKTTQLDDHTSITDCENNFHTRHPEKPV